jgi:hypothetical protein
MLAASPINPFCITCPPTEACGWRIPQAPRIHGIFSLIRTVCSEFEKSCCNRCLIELRQCCRHWYEARRIGVLRFQQAQSPWEHTRCWTGRLDRDGAVVHKLKHSKRVVASLHFRRLRLITLNRTF